MQSKKPISSAIPALPRGSGPWLSNDWYITSIIHFNSKTRRSSTCVFLALAYIVGIYRISPLHCFIIEFKLILMLDRVRELLCEPNLTFFFFYNGPTNISQQIAARVDLFPNKSTLRAFLLGNDIQTSVLIKIVIWNAQIMKQ